MLETLLEPFVLPFFREPLIMAMLIALPMALLSSYVVLKGWSLMGDAISHAVLPGIILSLLMGIPVMIGAFLSGLLCVFGAGYLKETSRIKEDTLIGVVFMGLFGLGLVLHSFFNAGFDIHDILFGHLMGIDMSDIWTSGAIAFVTLVAFIIWRKDMMLHTFDSQHARAIGLPVRGLQLGFMAILTLVIIGALESVGIILTVGMLVAPGVIGQLLSKRFGRMQLIAVVSSVGCAFLGTYLSIFIDSAPGATIVLLLTIVFFGAYVFSHFSAKAKA